jgi:hypothetical protein
MDFLSNSHEIEVWKCANVREMAENASRMAVFWEMEEEASPFDLR